jgi:hypothetical protein
MAAQLSPKDIEDLVKRAQDQAKIIEEQKERMRAMKQEISEKREYEEKLKKNLNEEAERRRRLEEAAASASASANDNATSQGEGSTGDHTMPSTADAGWREAGAAIVIPGANGMKLPDFTIRDDAEVWLERFSVYCVGATIPPTRQASVLLGHLDNESFTVLSKELSSVEKQNIVAIKAYMVKRFSMSQDEGHLRLEFRRTKQQNNTILNFYTELLTKAAKAFKEEVQESVEKDLMDQFIIGLNNDKTRDYIIDKRKSFNNIKEMLNAAITHEDGQNFSNSLKSNNLVEQQVNLIQNQQPSRGRSRAFNTGRGSFNPRGRGRMSSVPRQYNNRNTHGVPKCYNCGKMGHMARACYHKYQQTDYRSNSRRRETSPSSTSRDYHHSRSTRHESSRSRDSSRDQSRERGRDHSRERGRDYSRERGRDRDDSRNRSSDREESRERNSNRSHKTTAAINDERTTGDALYVTGKIENLHINMFVDCGSAISLISAELFQQILTKNNKIKLYPSSTQLQTVNKSPLKVLGQVNLNLDIEGTSRKDGRCSTVFQFYIAENLTHNILIGMDFLQIHRAVVDTGRKRLTIINNYGTETIHKLYSIPNSAYEIEVTATQEIAIAPGSEVIIEGKLSESLKYQKTAYFKPSAINNKLIASHSVVSLDTDTTIPVKLLNAGKQEIVVYVGAVLGSLEDLDDEDVFGSEITNRKDERDDAKEQTDEEFINTLDIGDDKIPAEEKAKLKRILSKYCNTFSRGATDYGRTGVIKHNIEIVGDKPKRQGPRPLTPPMRKELKKNIDEMLEAGIIRPSTSEYASPVVLVRKKDGSIRFCVDFRLLNKVTRPISYPLPRINDAMNSLGGALYFSTLDLKSGFFQVEMEEEDISKTAFTTSYGLFEFVTMPQGLRNSAATFQMVMDCLMAGLQYETMITYIDDLIIFGSTFKEHLHRLEEVLSRLQQANLKLSPKKCHLLKTKISYLGHVISSGIIQPDPNKIHAIVNYPRPTNIKELRSFLGLASYYRRFIRNFSQIATPLNRLLEKKVMYKWDENCEQAFKSLKMKLANDVLLAIPDFSRPFRVTTDASNIAVGAILSQIQEDGTERPIAFASQTLSKQQRKYSTIERETYAIIYALEQFRCYLFGQKFILITDHRPLVWLKTTTNPSPKLGRWQMKLEEFDFEIVYKQGKLNTNADALSRIEVNQY